MDSMLLFFVSFCSIFLLFFTSSAMLSLASQYIVWGTQFLIGFLRGCCCNPFFFFVRVQYSYLMPDSKWVNLRRKWVFSLAHHHLNHFKIVGNYLELCTLCFVRHSSIPFAETAKAATAFIYIFLLFIYFFLSPYTSLVLSATHYPSWCHLIYFFFPVRLSVDSSAFFSRHTK